MWRELHMCRTWIPIIHGFTHPLPWTIFNFQSWTISPSLSAWMHASCVSTLVSRTVKCGSGVNSRLKQCGDLCLCASTATALTGEALSVTGHSGGDLKYQCVSLRDVYFTHEWVVYVYASHGVWGRTWVRAVKWRQVRGRLLCVPAGVWLLCRSRDILMDAFAAAPVTDYVWVNRN